MTRTFLEWASGMKEKGLETIVTSGSQVDIRVLEDKVGIHFRSPFENKELYGTPLAASGDYQFVSYRNGEAALVYVDSENQLNVVSREGNVELRYKNVKEARVMPFGNKTLVATTPVSVDDVFSQKSGAEVVHTSDFKLSIQCHEIGEVVETAEGAYLPLRFGQDWKYMDSQFQYHTKLPQSESLEYKKVANG